MKMDIGNEFRKIREKIKMTQAEMAEYLEINQSTYSRYEKGIISPPAIQYLKMLELLKKK